MANLCRSISYLTFWNFLLPFALLFGSETIFKEIEELSEQGRERFRLLSAPDEGKVNFDVLQESLVTNLRVMCYQLMNRTI